MTWEFVFAIAKAFQLIAGLCKSLSKIRRRIYCMSIIVMQGACNFESRNFYFQFVRRLPLVAVIFEACFSFRFFVS